VYPGGVNVAPYIDCTAADADTEMARVYDAIVVAVEQHGGHGERMT